MPSTPRILEIIHEKAKQSGNHCGLTTVQLAKQTGLSLPEIKEEINKLFRENKVRVHDGAQGKLIFKN